MQCFYKKAGWLLGMGMLCAAGLLLSAPCQAAFVSTMELESETGPTQKRMVKAEQSRTLAEKLATIGYSQEEIAMRVSEVERLSTRQKSDLRAERSENSERYIDQ